VVSLGKRQRESVKESNPSFQTSTRSQDGTWSTSRSEIFVSHAHRQFMQFVSVDKLSGTVDELTQEARRLVSDETLTERAFACLDFDWITAFWRSEIGGKIYARRGHMYRGLAFTARFAVVDVARILEEPIRTGLDDEFMLFRGIAPFAFVLPGEIWLLDFAVGKTVGKACESEMKLRAHALSRIYLRPVTHCWLHFFKTALTTSIKT